LTGGYPGAERFGIGLVDRRAQESNSRITHARRAHRNGDDEVSTGSIVEFGTGKKSTEANIDAALAELVDGEARWADDTKMY
jgi:hypothetical protein